MASDKNVTFEQHVKRNAFHHYFERTRSPILVLHPRTFKILAANSSALEFLGFSLSEVKKKYIYSLAPVKQHNAWKSQFDLHKTKPSFVFQMPLVAKNKHSTRCNVEIISLSAPRFSGFAAMIDVANSEHIDFENKLRDQNRELSDQIKKMVHINRRIVNSYENIKKQYQELLDFQEDNVKAERHRTIGEMIEVLQDKINRPLNRILDDIQKIQDSEKKMDSTIIKRLKLIEESAENVLRLVARIAEVKDIKKMRYIELGNM
jgi:signal transduction histidine kinase